MDGRSLRRSGLGYRSVRHLRANGLPMMIVGIDPGLTGGFAIRTVNSIILETLPTLDGRLDLPELNRLFRHYADQITHAYLELSGTRPGQSAQSGFSTARGFGNLEGMLACLGVAYTAIRPQQWSPSYDHGVTEKKLSKRYALIKKSRARIAQELYPGIDMKRTPQCKNPDSGLVNALLIADFGWQKHKRWKDSK